MKNLILTLFFLFYALAELKADVTVSNAVQLQAALDDSSADNVIVINGTIYGRFIVNRSGTTTNPVIIRGGTISGLGVPDTTAGLDNALLAVLSESNVRIENVTFENNYIQGAKGIYITTASFNDAPLQNIFIDSCTLRDIGWSSDNTADPNSNASGTGQAHGILVTGRTTNTLTNVNVTNNSLNNIITGNSEALTLNGNVSDFLVQGNTISNITNIGIDIAGGFGVAVTGTDQARNGMVIANTVFNCRRPSSVSGFFEPAGIYVDGGANVEIYGNRSYQNGQGFSIGREQTGETLNINLTNNLSYFNAENGLVFGGNNGTVINSTVRNNTFYGNGADKPGDRSGISVQITQNCAITNNIIYEAVNDGIYSMFGISNFFGGTPPILSNNLVSGMATGFDLVNVGTNTDGLSVAPNLNLNDDFTPNTGSPVINAGNSTGIATSETDFLGANRISSSSVDIGAVESGSSETTDNFEPDPSKSYYLDVPAHNLRLAASGNAEDPYSTSTNTTGADVEWRFIENGNGSWHIQLAAGGTLPRLRTRNNGEADMQATTFSGGWTYFSFSKGVTDDTHFITLTDGPQQYGQLQINSNGTIDFVEKTRNGSWESFRITEVTDSSAATRIEAEDYDAQNGIQTQGTTDVGGGQNVGWINNGDWLLFEDINLSEISNMNARVASQSASGIIEVRLDNPAGNLIGSIDISSTGGYQSWVTLSTAIASVANVSDVYLVFTGGNGFLFNVNWIEFSGTSAAGKSIADVENTSVAVYPNPFTNSLTIDNVTSNKQALTKVEVLDLTGKVLFTESSLDSMITLNSLSNIASGVYLVRVINNQGQTVSMQKIIKE